MATVEGSNAWRALNQALVRRGQEDTPTLEERLGIAWDAACVALRDTIENNGGKACSGKITLEISVKACRTEHDEIEVAITPKITTKLPLAPLGAARVWLDHDAVAHTQPTQITLPIMGIRGAVEGGKEEPAPKATKKVV